MTMSIKHAWLLFALPLLGACLGFLGSAGFTYTMPKIYESTAVIEIHLLPGTPEKSDAEFKEFVLKEIKKLKDADIFDSIINDLDLTNRWATDKSQAHDLLAKSVSAERVRGTDLVSIHARHPNKIDARDIAMGVATAYQKRRAAFGKVRVQKIIDRMEEDIRNQEIEVDRIQREIDGLLRNQPAGQISEEQRLASNGPYRDAKQKLDTELNSLEIKKQELVSEKLHAKIPYESVLIRQAPWDSHTPVSPNVTFNLILGTGLGMLMGIPVALFTMWVMSRPKRVF